MPVDDSISLNAASAEELDELYQKEVVAKQIVAGIDSLNKQADEKVKKLKQKIPQGGGAPVDIKNKGTGQFDIFGNPISGEQKKPSGKIGGLGGAPQDLARDKKIEKIEEELARHDAILNNVKSQYANVQQFMSNPVNFFQSKLMGLVGKGGMAGLTALFGIDVITDIIDIIKEQFGPGGLFDVRKLVLDQTKQFLPEDQLKYYRSGEIYFANVRGQISQLPPTISNTESLVDGAMKYQALNAGY